MAEMAAVRSINGACTLARTTLESADGKETSNCFSEGFFLDPSPDWRDLPEYQHFRKKCTVTVLGGIGFPSLREVVASHANFDIPSDDDELLKVIRQRGMALSLPQVEDLAYLILRGRITGISEQWDCLFFVEDNYDAVVVGHLSAFEEKRRLKWMPGIYNIGMPPNLRMSLGSYECLMVRST